MAQEEIRGCGYRKVGGMYLCGDYIPVACDRLPYALETCPTCGGGIKVTRGYTKVNPLALFGLHDQQVPVFEDDPTVRGEVTKLICADRFRPCFMCDPTDDSAFIMGIGEAHYPTPDDFVAEAGRLGVSKRIASIPKGLELGKTVVYLAHRKACVARESAIIQRAMALVTGSEDPQPRLIEAQKVEPRPGIFSAFIPQRIEKLIWERDATPDQVAELEKRGITPVTIKDGDQDHA